MDPVSAACALLPFWVPLGNALLYLPFAFGTTLGSALLVRRIALRELRAAPPGTPWVERARMAFPARTSMLTSVLLAPILFGPMATLMAGPFYVVGDGELAWLAALAALAPGLSVYFLTEGEILRRRFGIAQVLRSVAAGLFTLSSTLIVVALVWVYLPSELGVRAYLVLALGVAAYALVLFGWGLRAARLLGLARPASPRLARIIDRTAALITATPSTRAGTRQARFRLAPRVYEVPMLRANAFALPLGNALAFTDGALAALSDEEIGAIAAHELGHITESPTVGLLRSSVGLLLIVGAIVDRMLVRAFAGMGESAHLAAILAVLVPYVLFVRFVVTPLATRMEKRADAIATGENEEGVYARALARIYEANLMPAVTGRKRQVHPELYDRLVAAGATPDYPRPAAPDRRAMRRPIRIAALLLILGVAAPVAIRAQLPAALRGSVGGIRVGLALTGGAWYLGELARLESAAGDNEAAVAFYAAGEVLAPRSLYYPANRAVVLAKVGRCDPARAALAIAVDHAPRSGPAPTEAHALDNARDAVRICDSNRRRGESTPD